jgi:hypothetical protein
LHICGVNRLLLSRGDSTYREAESLRPLFNPPEKELDWVTGACFGDLDLDGDLDLATGRHHYYGHSRVHVYVNDGLERGVPQFREATGELGIAPLPQKAPHVEIQDFDNDGRLDLYWSAFFAEGDIRRPFLCRGLGVREGLPRFDVPSTAGIEPYFGDSDKLQNVLPPSGRGMIYYVNGPAIDYDGDGDLDLLVANWPVEPSRLLRNETIPGGAGGEISSGNWLDVRVVGRTMNRMGVGARVAVYRAGSAGEREAMLGLSEVTLNGGYSSARPAVVHFGLGEVSSCDVVVQLPPPASSSPIVLEGVRARQALSVEER